MLGGTEEAPIGLELLDQYGEELELAEADFAVTAYNKTKKATVEVDFVDGQFVIDTTAVDANDDALFEEGDVVTVTFIHEETTLKAAAELTVVEGALLSSIELGEVVLPEKAEALSEDLEDVTIGYTALDQYGEAVELDKGAEGNVTVVSSNSNVIDPADVTFDKDEDDNTFLNIAEFGGAGKVTLTLVNRVTGATESITLEVLQQAGQVYSVELDKTELDIAEGGDAVLVDLTVTDKYGNEIDAEDYANPSLYTINTSNNTVAGAVLVTEANYEQLDAEQEDVGKLLVFGNGEEGDTAKITLTVNGTGETSVLSVSIGEAAVLSEIALADDFTANLIKGASSAVEFETLDRYGNAMALPAGYTVEFEASDEEVIAVTQEDNFNYSVEGLAAGAADLVVTVKNAADQTVDSAKASFKVVANNTENLTFEISDIAKLYKDGAADSDYAEAVEVTAKDKDGNEYAIPASAIVDIQSSNEDFAVAESTEDGWVVYGQDGFAGVDGAVGTDDDITTDKSVTLTVIFNAENEVKTITKDVVVSKEELKAASVEMYDLTLDGTDVDSDAEAVSTLAVDTFADLDAEDTDVFVVVKDQFGRYVVANDVANKASIDSYDDVVITVANATGYTDVDGDDSAVVTSGEVDFTTFAENTAVEDASSIKFRLVVTTGNAKVDYLDVTVDAEEQAAADAEAAEAAALATARQNLTTAISDASDAKTGVEISDDGSDVAPGTDWVTQAENDTFDTAIATATTALNTATTSTAVNNAITALNNAVTTYEAAKEDGTM